LRRARERKQIRIIRSRVEVLAQRLKEARSIEFNEIVREAAQARRRFALQRVAIETGTTLHAVNERHQPTAM
jgi:division protein CdvB (Snf7/Vps24/ESCRT-III family)